eukprot:CAMPEP_0117430678 /NCGR_PEP_ID=MMETSP0758-20121206/10234_1 /TAXON_ID=63605 /ORGANISM="Percolomonas cosmopolitus, Strain AE-1 (ATCC 50343)" /LENGTH=163 /DNA_ID=CAMNT_0005218971 /DNA_START=69 /DNA_END=557 /DNA_ORIENTATION=-
MLNENTKFAVFTTKPSKCLYPIVNPSIVSSMEYEVSLLPHNQGAFDDDSDGEHDENLSMSKTTTTDSKLLENKPWMSVKDQGEIYFKYSDEFEDVKKAVVQGLRSISDTLSPSSSFNSNQLSSALTRALAFISQRKRIAPATVDLDCRILIVNNFPDVQSQYV